MQPFFDWFAHSLWMKRTKTISKIWEAKKPPTRSPNTHSTSRMHCIGFKLTQLPTKCMRFFVCACNRCVLLLLLLLLLFLFCLHSCGWCDFSSIHTAAGALRESLIVFYSRKLHSYGSVGLWDSKCAGMLFLCAIAIPFHVYGVYIAELHLTLLFNIYFVMYGLHTVAKRVNG